MPKISELPAANAAAGSELLPVDQGGITKKLTLAQIIALIAARIGG